VRFGGFFRRHLLHRNAVAVQGYRLLRRAGAAAGFDIVLKTFYSPIPDLGELPANALDRRSPLAGLDFDLDAQMAWVERQLSEPMAGFRPAQPGDDGTRPSRYTHGMTSYTQLDATVLYGMLRRLRPARVIELGSGASTLVIAEALRANADDGAPARFEAYDPYPSLACDDLPGLDALHRLRAQDVPLTAFDALAEGDVLFVDTTHTVKVGSDVNFAVLEVFPRLTSGVVVHVHDVFLPYEYPRQWIEDFALYWTEQYLLQAFLVGNDGWEVLCGIAALTRDRGVELGATLPVPGMPLDGSAFWMRRRAGAGA
jgi:hypothetical protein